MHLHQWWLSTFHFPLNKNISLSSVLFLLSVTPLLCSSSLPRHCPPPPQLQQLSRHTLWPLSGGARAGLGVVMGLNSWLIWKLVQIIENKQGRSCYCSTLDLALKILVLFTLHSWTQTERVKVCLSVFGMQPNTVHYTHEVQSKRKSAQFQYRRQ